MGLFKKKDPIVEVEKALDHEVHEMEHDIQADVDAVMKKYDRESNTRIWEGAPKIALQVLMSAFSIYCILMTLFSKALPSGGCPCFWALSSLSAIWCIPPERVLPG